MTFREEIKEKGIYVVVIARPYISGITITAVRFDSQHFEILGDDRFYTHEDLDKIWVLLEIRQYISTSMAQ